MIQFLGDAILGAIFLVPAILTALLISLSQAAAFLMGIILDWIISPNFTSYSYTKPCNPPDRIVGDCNPVVGIGLNITQGFVNLLLVVVLVYVAISIALRLGGETNAKKIFVNLIIVALLVNFAPVLIGLIVDATNIVMNFFFSSIQGGAAGILNQGATIFDTVKGAVLASGAGFKDRLGLLAAGAFTVSLNLFIAFIFLIFAGLFVFRYIAIWILVILSPIALVLWVLPGKPRQFWNMWWNNLIQWSIIGIPISFFLYLALASFSAINRSFLGRIEQSSGIFPAADLTFVDRLIPYAVVSAFLGMGFLVSLATSAMGANAIIAGGMASGKFTRDRAWGGTKRASRATWRGTRNAGSQVMGRYAAGRQAGQGRIGAFGRAVGGATGAGVRQVGSTVAGWASVRSQYRTARQAGVGKIRSVFMTTPARSAAGAAKGVTSFLGGMAGAWVQGATKKKGKAKGKAFCSTCGATAPSGSNFCQSCGSPI